MSNDDQKKEVAAALELDAVAMVRQYRLFMPTGIRTFLIKLSGFLAWDNLYKELTK